MFTRRTINLLRPYLTISKKNCNQNQNQLISATIRCSSGGVVVLGGGAMGSSVAYWLREKSNVKVTVIEKDPTYSTCSTSLSVGGIRHQFALPENIRMSLFGSDFIKNIKTRFGPEADISYMPNGYLILASSGGAHVLEDNFKLQQELGATNCLLTKEQLRKRFAWLNVEGIELGCMGCEREGWFDPWGLLSLLKKGAISKGADFIHGEIVSFIFGQNEELQGVQIQMANKELKTINFEQCVIAAGAESGNIAKLAKIGTGSGQLSVPLPVEKRKRYVYRFDSQGANAPEKNSPLTIDVTGAYFRNDGVSYIGGMSPRPDEEPTTENLDVDFEFFDNTVWPILAQRIPAFESAKIRSAWGGYYEFNTFDANGIIGPHPYYSNLYFTTGFSGHGIQQSPAAGLAVAELILEGRFKTIDLSRMGFDRLITNKPLYETEIY